MVLSNHLLFEYEEIGKKHASEMHLSFADIDDVLDALCSTAEKHTLLPRWESLLSDPDDEPLVQLGHFQKNYSR